MFDRSHWSSSRGPISFISPPVTGHLSGQALRTAIHARASELGRSRSQFGFRERTGTLATGTPLVVSPVQGLTNRIERNIGMRRHGANRVLVSVANGSRNASSRSPAPSNARM